MSDKTCGGSSSINEKVQTWFPPLKWVLGGITALMIASMSFALSMKIETIDLRKELESEQKINKEQDKKIDKTYELMQSISKEQARIAQSMENLSVNMTEAMRRVASDTSEIRSRVDRHIEESNH